MRYMKTAWLAASGMRACMSCPVCTQVWSLVLMKYFQVQNVMTTPAVVAAATFGLNIASNFIFIDAFGFKV